VFPVLKYKRQLLAENKFDRKGIVRQRVDGAVWLHAGNRQQSSVDNGCRRQVQRPCGDSQPRL